MILKHKAIDEFKWTHPVRDLLVELFTVNAGDNPGVKQGSRQYYASCFPATPTGVFLSATVIVAPEVFKNAHNPEVLEHETITRMLKMLDGAFCKDEA